MSLRSLEQMGRCSPPHGGFTSRVVDLLTHAGYMTVQDGIGITNGIQWCIGASFSIQWPDEECKGTWWYVVTHDTMQQELGA